MHLESLRLIPYGERAHPALPASCTPQATETANKQMILKLLSTILNPARATPQTPRHQGEHHLHAFKA